MIEMPQELKLKPGSFHSRELFPRARSLVHRRSTALKPLMAYRSDRRSKPHNFVLLGKRHGKTLYSGK